MALSAMRRLFSSLRRKVRFDDCGVAEENEFAMGFREACKMCDVLVQSASVRRLLGGRLRSPSWIKEHAGPGIDSIACASSDPCNCCGVALGADFDGSGTLSGRDVGSTAGRSRKARPSMSSMHAIFITKVWGSEPYATVMALVTSTVSIPRIRQRSRRALTTVVRERWMRPVI